MSDIDNEPGRMEIRGRTNGPTINDGTLITFDEPVDNLSERDLLFIQSSDGTDLPGLTLENERGTPPRVSYSMASMNLEFQLVQVDDRTWRLQFEPHHKEIIR
jgi:hypothetical protein